jgi:predicted transcriptional regulator
MGQEEFEMLLTFFKVLGNDSRLKIMGIVANGERTVSELAAMLDLKEPTVSQHLNMLKDAGLVDMRPEGNYRYYSFNNKALHKMNKEMFSREGLASLVPNYEDLSDAFERKVFKTFIDGERITQLPVGEKRMRVILRWLADKFEEGIQYTEKQVNEILKKHHEDYATLRRDLVDFHYLNRQKGVYWKSPTPSN